MSEAYSEFFSGRGHPFSSLIQAQFFSVELILSNLSTKNDSRGVRKHAPPRIGESWSHFWPLTLSASPIMHFVRTVLIMRA